MVIITILIKSNIDFKIKLIIIIYKRFELLTVYRHSPSSVYKIVK